MRLNSNDINIFRQKFNNLHLGTQVLIHDNGTFEIYDVSESDISRLKNLLSRADFIEHMQSIKSGSYDFSHFDFSKGYAEPKAKYKIIGNLKELQNENGEDDIDGVAINDKIKADTERDAKAGKVMSKEADWENRKWLLKDIHGNILGEEPMDEELDESVEKHETLNPKLGNEDNTLKPEVEEKINAIVADFLADLAEDEIKINVKDVKLVGSNASYNGNDKSDLDIHIEADTDSLNCPANLYPLVYSAYRSIGNKNHDVEFYGIPVEIFVETSDTIQEAKQTALKSNGIYSVMNHNGIKEPVAAEIPDLDQDAFDQLLAEGQQKYEEAKNSNSSEEITNFIEDIYDLRKTSIANNGEYGIGNLVFKEIRNLGELDELKELKNKIASKELSLESLQESYGEFIVKYVKDGKKYIEDGFDLYERALDGVDEHQDEIDDGEIKERGNSENESLNEDLIFNYKTEDADKLFDLYNTEPDEVKKAYLKDALSNCLYQLYFDKNVPDDGRESRGKEISNALNEGLNEEFTPAQKIELGHSGERIVNVKLCSDEKLLRYYNIAFEHGFIELCDQILTEVMRRYAQANNMQMSRPIDLPDNLRNQFCRHISNRNTPAPKYRGFKFEGLNESINNTSADTVRKVTFVYVKENGYQKGSYGHHNNNGTTYRNSPTVSAISKILNDDPEYTATYLEDKNIELNWQPEFEEMNRYAESLVPQGDYAQHEQSCKDVGAKNGYSAADLPLLASFCNKFFNNKKYEADRAERQRKAEEHERAVNSNSNAGAGEIGDIVEFIVASAEIKTGISGPYYRAEPYPIYEIKDEQGRVYTGGDTSRDADLERGCKVSGKIRDLTEFRGIKQTRLTRVKVISRNNPINDHKYRGFTF